MRKHVEESVATGAAAGRGRGGRFSAGRKREGVLRLLRGEDLESVSRAVGITAARASHWRAQFLAAGQAGLKSRATDARDDDHRRLQAKIGELLMETELLYAKVDQLEASGPLARRRSTRPRVELLGRRFSTGGRVLRHRKFPELRAGARRQRRRGALHPHAEGESVVGAELRDHRGTPPGLARVQADIQRTVDAGEIRLSKAPPRCDATSSGWTRQRRSEYRQTTVQEPWGSTESYQRSSPSCFGLNTMCPSSSLRSSWRLVETCWPSSPRHSST